uniref:Uncharacterized protein n=1 Tax=viral metagenome TaxID=1070528 RepID=A0A6C0BTL1_9ZZZZ
MNNELIKYDFSKPYVLSLKKDEYYHQLIAEYYCLFLKIYKPINRSVTYLVWSGISYPAFNTYYFPTTMTKSYSRAFNVHQKPHNTYSIHIKYIEKYPYFYYLSLIAFPVDVYSHSLQFLFGETGEFLEGGAFFIPYQIIHWVLLVITLMSPHVYKYFPEFTWKYYFSLIYYTLALHDKIYKLSIRRLTMYRRISEFILLSFMTYVIANKQLIL